MKIKHQVGRGTSAASLGLHPSLVHGLSVAQVLWAALGLDRPVVTGLQEDGHSEGSLHYGAGLGDLRCRAGDLRIPSRRKVSLGDTEVKQVVSKLRELLGPSFDVVLEKNSRGYLSHIHIEADFKKVERLANA